MANTLNPIVEITVCVHIYSWLCIMVSLLLTLCTVFHTQDLAAHNVLVSKKEVCKVADFGLLRETVDGVYQSNKVHSVAYMIQSDKLLFSIIFRT